MASEREVFGSNNIGSSRGSAASRSGAHSFLNLFQVRQAAASVIGRAYRCYKFRTTFKYLRSVLFEAERSLTLDVLRKISPREAEILTDGVCQARVRFRFGGMKWPPTINYKVFTTGGGVQYFSGQRLIAPGSDAARDSCNIMGTRLFIENMIMSEQRMHGHKVTEQYQVSNRVDFIQYMTSLDERPAYEGGRNNRWRELGSIPMGAQMVFFDFLRRNPRSGSIDPSKDLALFGLSRSLVAMSGRSGGITPGMYSTIKSRKTQKREKKFGKLRKLYGYTGDGTSTTARTRPTTTSFTGRDNDNHGDELLLSTSDDEEFRQLYEWADKLSVDHLERDVSTAYPAAPEYTSTTLAS